MTLQKCWNTSRDVGDCLCCGLPADILNGVADDADNLLHGFGEKRLDKKTLPNFEAGELDGQTLCFACNYLITSLGLFCKGATVPQGARSVLALRNCRHFHATILLMKSELIPFMLQPIENLATHEWARVMEMQRGRFVTPGLVSEALRDEGHKLLTCLPRPRFISKFANRLCRGDHLDAFGRAPGQASGIGTGSCMVIDVMKQVVDI